MAVVIVSIGLVLGAEKLKPISWRDWAGEIERDGGARNPYMILEQRYGFWDVRVSFSSCFCSIIQLDVGIWAVSVFVVTVLVLPGGCLS